MYKLSQWTIIIKSCRKTFFYGKILRRVYEPYKYQLTGLQQTEIKDKIFNYRKCT